MKKLAKWLAVAALVPLLGISESHGKTSTSNDVRILRSVVPIISDYHASTKQLPQSWDDLSSQPNGSVVEVLISIGAGQLYGFIEPNVKIKELGDQQLLMLRKEHIDTSGNQTAIQLTQEASPNTFGIKESYNQDGDDLTKLRYAVVLSGDSKIKPISISEPLVQRIITDYRIKIRPSGNIESFAAERRTTEGDDDIVQSPDIRPTPMTKTKNQSVEVTENQPTQPTTLFPWLFVFVGIILLAVIGVIGFKVLGKSS